MSYFHFRASDSIGGERRSALEEIYSPLCGLDINLAHSLNHVDVKVKVFPSLAISAAHLSEHRAYRSYQHLADGDDSMLLIIPRHGQVGVQHRRRTQYTCAPGELHMVPVEHPFVSFGVAELDVATISLPAQWVETRLARANDWIGKTQAPVSAGALRLLTGYLDAILPIGDNLSKRSEQLAEQHLQDLVGLVLGMNDADTHVALGRGGRYARLRMMRLFARQNMKDPGLGTESIARHFGISAQYVRKIFRESGTTFSDYLNGIRLEWVYDQLNGGEFANRQIAVLAYEVGFNNLAWFNRSFRSRFDMTPSEVGDGMLAGKLQVEAKRKPIELTTPLV